MNARKKYLKIGMKKNPRSACFKRNELKERKTETKTHLQIEN